MTSLKAPSKGKTAAVFIAIAAVWYIFDRVVKTYIDAAGFPGQVVVPDVGGLFMLQIVHNTGAAWGMLGDSTMLLGIFSLIVCAAIAWYIFGMRKGQGPMGQTVALAFVFAGGLGNAIDRLTLGYVVDFINCTFIDFPVFNIADIGVTCGIALFLIMILTEDHADRADDHTDHADDHATRADSHADRAEDHTDSHADSHADRRDASAQAEASNLDSPSDATASSNSDSPSDDGRLQ